MIRVLICDDHPVILEALERIFTSHHGFDIAGSCSNGNECLRLVRSRRPDVVILDLSMPVLSGLSVLEELKGEDFSPRIVVWTAGFDDDEVLRAVRLGAHGVVLKQSSPEDLIDVVRRVHSGCGIVDEESVMRAIHGLSTDRPRETVDLSDRQTEVAGLASRGLSNKEIAALLNISSETVKTHLQKIYDRLGVSSRVELGQVARKRGLL